MINKYEILVRSDQEIRELKLLLFTRFTYTMIALSENKEQQIENLVAWAEIKPDIMASSYFGRTDN